MSTAQKLKICFMRAAQSDNVEELLLKTFPESALKILQLMQQYTLKRPLLQNSNSDSSPNSTIIFVAERKNKVLGTIQCSKLCDNAYAVGWLCVEEKNRKKGIGKSLIDHAEQYISQALLSGNPGLIVLSDRSKFKNPESRYYENMGYHSAKDIFGPEGFPLDEDPTSPTLAKLVNIQPSPV